MWFSSTRNPSVRVSLAEAASAGFPGDGGLFVPSSSEPDLRGILYQLNKNLTFNELASLASTVLFGEDLDPVAASRLSNSAYSFSPSVIEVDDSVSLVDLSTGPSGSFKDFGMAFLSGLLGGLSALHGRTVLLATTGDTGAAAAEAFRGDDPPRLVLLYPDGPVRGIRPELLARNGGFVETVRVPGSLEDCRRLVRGAFDNSGKKLGLIPATSANVARLLAQVFYYLYAFVSLRDRNPGDFLVAVPSGNLGNLISGLYAWRWGVPISGFIVIGEPGPQSSDALLRFLFEPSSSESRSPYTADDPENRERIRALAAGSPDVLRALFYPVAVSETDALQAVSRLYGEYGLFASPETGRAWAAAERVLDDNRLRGAAHIAVFADSHPSKHASEVATACGCPPPVRFPDFHESFSPDEDLPLDGGALEAFLSR